MPKAWLFLLVVVASHFRPWVENINTIISHFSFLVMLGWLNIFNTGPLSDLLAQLLKVNGIHHLIDTKLW